MQPDIVEAHREMHTNGFEIMNYVNGDEAAAAGLNITPAELSTLSAEQYADYRRNLIKAIYPRIIRHITNRDSSVVIIVLGRQVFTGGELNQLNEEYLSKKYAVMALILKGVVDINSPYL